MIQEHPSNFATLETRRQSDLMVHDLHHNRRPASFWADLGNLWRQVRVVHATRRSLRARDAHQLRDIGVERDVIDAVVRASFLAHLTVAGLDRDNNRHGR